MENRRRMGDQVVDQLRQDLSQHRTDFDKHVQRFDDHLREEHEDRKAQRAVQRQNAENISNLTVAVTDLTKTVQAHIETTRPLVETYRDFQGSARIGSGILHFAGALAKWGAIGLFLSGAVIASAEWVARHTGH